MTAVQTPRRAEPGAAPVRRRRRPVTPARVLLHVFLVVTSLVFLFPLLYAVYTSLRPYAETAKYGYFSLPRGLTFDNYVARLAAVPGAALPGQHADHRGAVAAC